MRRSTVSLEIALLGFLQKEPLHGYAIHQALSDPAGLGPVWGIKLSRLYALLGKLEHAGYLTAVIEPQENKPPRKTFHLTPAGEQAYRSWLTGPVRHGRSLRLEFLVKLYFVRFQGPGAVAGLLAAQRERCLVWLAAERETAEAETAAGRPYSRLVHRFRMGQVEAMLDWLDQCEQEFAHED